VPSKTDERFAAAVTTLGEAFRQQVTSVTIRAYEIGLKGIPLAAIEQAIAAAIGRCRFMPVPCELRQLAGELGPEDRAIKAWDAFTKALHTHGWYASVDFDDSLINATVRNLGGWMPLIDRMEAEGDKWTRKDFERVYASLAKTGINESDAQPLVGFHEQNNRFLGYSEAVKPPVRITTNLPPLRIGVEPARIGTDG